ncbi:MAG: hypothetical protein AB1331_00265 [Bacillota bacterium]
MVNSGFSKVYSAFIPGFIIYDSRVAATLCLLIRQYCVEKRLPAVTEALRFAWRQAKGDSQRDPTQEPYLFPKLSAYSRTYLLHNMRANWLLGAAIQQHDSPFWQVGFARGLRALESRSSWSATT